MCAPSAAATTSGLARRCSSSRRPRPRDCVTANRHDSAPGQLVTSATLDASASPRLAAARRRYSSLSEPTGHGWDRFGRCRIDLEQRDAALPAAPGELALIFLEPALPAQRLDHELHAIALLVLVIPQPMKHPQERLDHPQNLRRRNEL